MVEERSELFSCSGMTKEDVLACYLAKKELLRLKKLRWKIKEGEEIPENYRGIINADEKMIRMYKLLFEKMKREGIDNLPKFESSEDAVGLIDIRDEVSPELSYEQIIASSKRNAYMA